MQGDLAAAIARRFGGDVEIGELYWQVFPTLRIRGEGIRVRQRGAASRAPLIEIQSFTLRASFASLMATPRRIRSVERLRWQTGASAPRSRSASMGHATNPGLGSTARV
jgi:hypothetical protein